MPQPESSWCFLNFFRICSCKWAASCHLKTIIPGTRWRGHRVKVQLDCWRPIFGTEVLRALDPCPVLRFSFTGEDCSLIFRGTDTSSPWYSLISLLGRLKRYGTHDDLNLAQWPESLGVHCRLLSACSFHRPLRPRLNPFCKLFLGYLSIFRPNRFEDEWRNFHVVPGAPHPRALGPEDLPLRSP